MLRSQLQALFDLMDENEYRSASYFSQRLGVSLKTVRNYMKELTSALKSNGADVQSKARHGYRIVIHDPEKFSAFIKQEKSDIPRTSSDRNLYLLNFLLSNDDYVKIDDLCSLLYISRTVVSSSIHSVEKTLNQYGLHLERKPNYGLRIVGEEFDIRRLLCYSQFKHKVFTDLGSDYSFMEDDRLWTGKTILELLSKYDIHLTEVAFDNFVNYVYVGLQRLISRKHLYFNTRSVPVSGIKEKSFVDELVACFHERYGVVYSRDEKEYILLYLSGKQMAGYTVKSDENFVISEEINTLCLDILKFIDKEYNCDFTSNFDLRVALYQHLVPLEVRMKYGLPLTNPLVEETKNQYPLAYGMALHAKTVLCNHYKKDLSEYEIAYLALIFALHLKKSAPYVQKKLDILIVSNANTSALNLLKYRYENGLSNMIGKVYISDLISLRHFDFDKIDYVLTTIPIMIEIPKPIFEIDLFAEDSETRNIEDALWKAETVGLRTCYSPKRFITDIKGKDKDSILAELCALVAEQEDVSENFYDLVMQREKDLHVAYGNGIAIPHPDRIASKYTFAYVAILDEPVEWNGESIQVILLSSPGKEDAENRQNFYESAARLVLDAQVVQSLVEKPTFEHFVDLIKL